jgi:NAD(P)-dependent dehydrogenase (short-subunit alcohol dehydrogenase family)
MRKSVLITGATGVLGKSTALAIAKSGAEITLLARDKTRLETVKNEIIKETGNQNIDIIVADLSDISSIKSAATDFKQNHDHLDVLINVAGVYRGKREVTKDNLELMFATNHLGPFILTNALLKLLNAGKHPKIINVSAPSTTEIKFEDLQGEKNFSSLKAFGASKMMNILFTYSLSRRLDCTRITSSVFHPGLMKSDIIKEMPGFLRFIIGIIAKKPDKAAKMLYRLAIDNEYASTSGTFYKFNGDIIKSSEYSYDKEIQDKLWKISEELAGKMN